MILFIALLTFVACQKNSDCDVPMQSTHLNWNLQTCTSVETATADTIYVNHDSGCECEDYCATLERARQNTLRSYQTTLDTTSNKELREKTEKDFFYLNTLTPNCNCK